ncbi:MAG TPA: proton-conducting transporter membrane subunit [Candidatus Acidoferrales bacterium]|nr:proton-conducting transporter membrane subunit [Candidatus Acidoferrales bacterium]
MILALIILPLLAGLTAFGLPRPAARRGLLLGLALVHAVLTAGCWESTPSPALGGWLAIDATGLLFLSITSGLFLVVSVYVVGYLGQEANRRATDPEEGFLFDNAPEAVFIGCLLLFLAAMTLVTVSQHFGLLWVAVEATTLASAPLIYFHRHHRSLEATWKYLLICSVGIALALLANFFLGLAATQVPDGGPPMVLSDLVSHAATLEPAWFKVACILFFVGYGTKMSLAPLHTWLPDAHSEAPSAVSALLSGAVLNCAFLGLLRVQEVCVAAGLADFSRDIWIALGLISLVVSAVFILGQTDYKRLLAYSSVENMGIIAMGMGLGGVGVFGAMLQAVNHSLAKGMLFLLSGNVLARYQSKSISKVRGLLLAAPATGLLWLAGFLAITGTPPFGLFLSKFTILKAAFDGGHFCIALVLLGFLAVIFIGMTTAFLAMAQGEPEKTIARGEDCWWQIVPPAVLGFLVLCLGLTIPAKLGSLLHQVASTLGGTP